MIGIYVMSSLTGGIEFFRIKNVNEKYLDSLKMNEEQKDPQEIELNEINVNHLQYK